MMHFRYNNKTYRVDDIDWEANPESTFSTKQGDVSYVDYYKKVGAFTNSGL